MSLNRYAKATDANQAAIVATYRQVPGVTVEIIGQPVDLLVGCLTPCGSCGHWERRNYLVEAKRAPGPRGGTKDRELTPGQERFFARWRGQVTKVTTPLEALEAIGKGGR